MFKELSRQSISCALAGILLENVMYADSIVVDTAAGQYRPLMDTTANGIPLINIVKPSGSGLSHNKYTEFNIDQSGVILNNATSAVQTQLGGWVQGNASLGSVPARVILNEVTGTNRSLLRGYAEVAGHSADVIVANPNGITVNGGGFINTPRATLTTGEAVINAGRLEGFHVREGDILIEDSGMNTNNIDRVELYTKALQINAKIHAKALEITTGEHMIARDGTIISDGASGNGYSIDSSELGGIYGSMIRLIGTDRGVGINLPPIAYASDSMQLTAEGKIVVSTAVADHTVQARSDSMIVKELIYGGESIELSAANKIHNFPNALIFSKGEIKIHETGTLLNDAARIEAAANLSIQAGSIENLSNMTPILNTEHISRYVTRLITRSANSDYWNWDDLYTEKWLDSINKTGYQPAYILSGNDLTLEGAIHNRYSMIASDRDIYLFGSLNNESDLNAHNIIQTQMKYVREHQDCGWTGCHWYNNSYWGPLTRSDTITDHVYSTISAGRNLYGNLISVNNGSVKEGTNLSSSGVAPSSYVQNFTSGEISYGLPHGGNGEFLISMNPSHPYLIESNPLFTDFSTFVSSDYMMSRLNLNMAANTKRFGDARYETQLVRDAVFRLTGERYLPGFGSDTEQFQALMDNAISVAGDLKLSLGISLSSSQLASLDRDIVWMEEKIVEEHRVLVPVVYLATLKNSTLDKGGKIAAGEDMVVAVRNAIDNGGVIRSGGNLIAVADSLSNEGGSISSGNNMLIRTTGDLANTSGTISGNNIVLVSNDGSIVSQSSVQTISMDNHTATGSLALAGERGQIWAQDNLLVQAAEDIVLKGSETSAGGKASFEAQNVTLSSAEQMSRYTSLQSSTGSSEYAIIHQNGSSLNAGSDILIHAHDDIHLNSSTIKGEYLSLNAVNSINITASNDLLFSDIKNSSKHTLSSSSAQDMNLKESVVSSTMTGENIAMTSGRDITLQAANLKATENIQVDAAGEINVFAKEYREGTLHQESKSSLGGLISYSSLDSTDAVKLHEATVKTDAKNIIMNSGKDINVVASNVSAGDTLGLKAVQNVNIFSDEEQNTQQHYSKKSRLSLDFSDGMLTVAEVKQANDDKANVTQKSANLSGKAIAVEAGQDVTSIGSKMTASTIDVDAQRDVNLLSATESANHNHKESTAKAGIGITLNKNDTSLFAGVITKSDKLGEGQTREVGSQLVGDNVSVHSGNNTNVLASNVIANNDVSIQADKNINILSQDSTAYKNQVHEELKAGIKVGVQQHVTDAAKQLASNAQSLPKSDNALNAASTVLRSVDLVSNTLSHSVSAGFDAIAEMSKSETSSQSVSAQSSAIAAGDDVTLDAGKEVIVTGSDVMAGNKVSINAENITLKSSAQNASSSSSDKSGSLKVTLFGTREGQVDGSYAQSSNRSNETTQRDTYVSANDVTLNTSGDTTLQGAHVSGNTVMVNIGGNLNLISVQDTGSSKGDSESVALSTAGSASVGARKSSGSKAWVEEQTGIIATEKADITVAKNTDLQGAIIATIDANGNDANNVHLTTETLSASDISDHDKSTSISIGLGNISVVQFQTNSQGTTGGTLEAGYGYSDKEQINRATIGGGTITLANQESVPTILNRDITASQEITKDESANYDIYASQNSINSVLNPTQTAENWKQSAKDMGLSVHKEITENLPNSNSDGFAGVVGKALDTAEEYVPFGLLPTQANGGGYVTQIATQLFGDNRTGIIVENKETLLKAGVPKDDIQEVILIKTEKGIKKAEDFKDTDTVLDTVTLYRTDPNKTIIIGNLNDKTGDPSLENYKIRLSAEDVKNSGIDHLFTNGMFNSIDTAAYNQQTQQGKADGILNYNQQHGIIGDLLESAQDAIVVNTGLSALGTGGARQTGEVIDQMATITNGNLTVGAHSQGTLMSQVGMEKNKEHLQELVQGNKDGEFLVGYAGSPVNHTIAEELVMDIYGGEEGIKTHVKDGTISDVFRSNVSPQDAVGSFLGWQSAGINNSENLGVNMRESLLAAPRLFGIAGNSSHSYYPCVIGCGNENYTPDIKNYYTLDAKDGVKEHSRSEYYKDNFTNKDRKMTINMDLLPQTNKSDSIQSSTQTILDATQGQ